MFNDLLIPNLYSLPDRGKYTHNLEAGQSDIYSQTQEGQLY